MLRSRILGFLWLLFVCLFYIFNDASFGFLLIVLTVMLIVLLMLNIWLIHDKVSLTFQTIGTVNKREQGTLYLNVKNHSLFPVTKVRFDIRFKNNLTGEFQKETFFASVDSRKTSSYPIQLSSVYCGRIDVQIDSVIYYDFLGIFSRRAKTNDASSMLYILPEFYDMTLRINPADVGFRDSSLYENNRRGDDGLEIFGIKEYEPEDNLKNVHWNLTSKFDELIVKELSEAVNYTFLILLDFTVEKNKRNEPQIIDAMVDTFVSVSEALLDAGYSHYIGWADSQTKSIQLEEVFSKEQLVQLLKVILGTEQITSQTSTLEMLADLQDKPLFSHIIQVVSQHAPMMESNYFPESKVISLLCQVEDSSVDDGFNASVAYTPETMTEKLQHLSF